MWFSKLQNHLFKLTKANNYKICNGYLNCHRRIRMYMLDACPASCIHYSDIYTL